MILLDDTFWQFQFHCVDKLRVGLFNLLLLKVEVNHFVLFQCICFLFAWSSAS